MLDQETEMEFGKFHTPAERAQQVLEQVTDDPASLDMSNWEYQFSCATTRCIAGWTQYFEIGYVDIDSDALAPEFVSNHAQRLLGLSNEDAGHLFHTNPSMAIAGLQYIAQGKAIDWDEIYRREREEQ